MLDLEPRRWSDAPPLPAALQVEVTSACNLRCTMCLVSYRPPVNKLAGAMPLAMFAGLVDELPELRQLTLQGLGEPLLSPYLLDMVRHAKSRRVRVGFNSNATLLHRRFADELVATGLDWLHVSVDGARAETYEGIRDGASFDRVVDNLAGLVAARRAVGRDTPWVRVVFVAMRRNVGELSDLVRLLASIGVDELRVQNLSHTYSDTDPAGRYGGIREFTAAEALWTGGPDASGSETAGPEPDRVAAREAFHAARRAAADTGITLRLPVVEPAAVREPGRPGCTWPWDATYVTSAGAVQPCCMVMGDDRVVLGRLTERTFPEIWYGQPYREFRRRLAAASAPEVCLGCALYQGTF